MTQLRDQVALAMRRVGDLFQRVCVRIVAEANRHDMNGLPRLVLGFELAQQGGQIKVAGVDVLAVGQQSDHIDTGRAIMR